MTKHRSKNERKAEIIEAAAHCFATSGYHETTMDDIVKACGLSKGALYWHFKNKRSLFQALIDEWTSSTTAEVEALLNDNARPARDRLRALFVSIGRAQSSRPDLARAQLEFMALATRDEDFRAWYRSSTRRLLDAVTQLLEAGVVEKSFRSIQINVIAWQIVSMLDGSLFHHEIMTNAEEGGPPLWNLQANTFLSLLER